MFTLPGYQILAELYESRHSVAFRAKRMSDLLPVVIKALKDEFPPLRELTKYQNEFAIVSGLSDCKGIARVLGMEKVHNQLALVVEDFGADSLRRILETRQFTLVETLQIGVGVASCLAEIHAAQIIHKDINPSNILYRQETGEVRVIDFGIASRLPRENPGFKSPEIIEGTLAYMAPEQTGRMNCSVDFRADLYSFGATLYHLLTGGVPFDVRDARQLIQSHLAETPVPPHRVKPEIPRAVSAIVLKLMAKAPEQRYQSAIGVRADLSEALARVRQGETSFDLTLASQDFCDKLLIPQKLYGREREIEQLLAGFERVREGHKRLLLVSGYSGYGKTALVREVHKPLTRRQGTFVSGKFDQFQRGRPYTAILDALVQMSRMLLAERDEQVADWKARLLSALGPNGQVILEILPEFERLLGPQPPVPELPPAEQQNRFNLVFERFVGAMARPEHPLVLFLDDLQWADLASLKLIQAWMRSPEIQSLYLIGAYRDNEVDTAHPLMLATQAMGRDGVDVDLLPLPALELAHVHALIEDTLRRSPGATAELSDLLMHRSGGNPFLIDELLEALSAEGLLWVDGKSGQWRWEIERIRAHDLTDNAADLMARRIRKLDPEVQQLLRVASCLGSHFDLRTLSVTREQSLQETFNVLTRAVAAGLVTPIGEVYQEMLLDVSGSEAGTQYRFTHDKIQQAAGSLIPPHERRPLLYALGKTLLASLGGEALKERSFEIANFWNQSQALIRDVNERKTLVRLNLEAGRRARASAAYQTAFEYFGHGLAVFEDSFWDEEHALSFDLHVEAAEAAYLNENTELLEKCLKKAIERSRRIGERLRALEIQVLADISRERNREAIRCVVEAVENLGVRFPARVTLAHVLLSLLRTKLMLSRRSVDDLLALPALATPEQLATMRLMVAIGPSAYVIDTKQYVHLVLKVLQYSIRHGNSAYACIAYAGYGVLLCGVMGDMNGGARFGDLALKILDRFHDNTMRGYVLFILGNFIVHWTKPLRDTLPYFLDGYQYARDNGDLIFANYCLSNYCYHSYLAGVNLETLLEDCLKYKAATARSMKPQAFHTLCIYHQAVLNLLDRSVDPRRLKGQAYDEETELPQHIREAENVNVFDVCFNRMILCYLFQDHARALEASDKTAEYLELLLSTYAFAAYHFYDSLARLAMAPLQDPAGKRRALSRVRANQKKLRSFARNAPQNHQHKFCLVEAEQRRVQGKIPQATQLYDRAIQLSKEHGFVNEEALALELAGAFHLARGKATMGQSYLKEARYAYLRWGAQAKVQDLDRRYPDLDHNRTES